MATNTIEIKCLNDGCEKWFDSPVFFEKLEDFETSGMDGCGVICTHCEKEMPLGRENMRVRADEGGFLGTDTIKP